MIKTSLPEIYEKSSTPPHFFPDPLSVPQILIPREIPVTLSTKKAKLKFANLGPADAEQLEFWNDYFQPDAWAIRCGTFGLPDFYLIVLDDDRPDLHANRKTPSPYWVRTPRGIHYYFWCKEPTGIPCSNLVDPRGVHVADIKSSCNSYVLFYEASEELKALTFHCLPAFFTAQGILGRVQEYLGIKFLGNTVRPTPVKSLDGILDNLSLQRTSEGKEEGENCKEEGNSKVHDFTGEPILGNRNIWLFKTARKKAIWQARWINEDKPDQFSEYVISYARDLWYSLPDKSDFPLEEANIIGFKIANYLIANPNKRAKKYWQMTTPQNALYRKQKQTEALAFKNRFRNARIKKLSKQGHSLSQIAAIIGLSKSGIRKIIH